MKGFIEVTAHSALVASSQAKPTIFALKAILKVASYNLDPAWSVLTLSIKEQRYEDGPSENEIYIAQVSYDQMRKKMRDAALNAFG